MYRLLVISLFVCGCSAPSDDPQSSKSAITTTGALQNKSIDEASGLARSQRDPEIFWVINDEGKARVHATDRTGAVRGHVNLVDARNVDWEDLASFRMDGVPYLLVADTGDNHSRRDVVTFYIVEEPDLALDTKSTTPPAWRIDFTYPDGPRDAESVAVDIENRRVFVLSKRNIPAVLYELPLVPDSANIHIAKRLGPVNGLPQPSRKNIRSARRTDNYYWQSTGMDLSADDQWAAIVTYGAIYYFRRDEGQDWLDALQEPHAAINIRNYPKAESVAFDVDSRSVYFTVEKKNAPILRIDAVPDEIEGR